MWYNGLMGIEAITNKIHYPKLITLVTCIFAAYALFQFGAFDQLPEFLHGRGYLSVLVAGFLFAYGFTAPFAVAIFIAIAPDINMFLGALIAGFGAFIADLLIFRFIKTSFQDEFDRLKFARFMQWLKNLCDNHLSERIKKYVLWTFSGFLIASPLPDEFGVTILSGFTDINKRLFSIISYSLNTCGIFLVLLGASFL